MKKKGLLLLMIALFVVIGTGCVSFRKACTTVFYSNIAGQNYMYELCSNYTITDLEYDEDSSISYTINNSIYVVSEWNTDSNVLVGTIRIHKQDLKESRDIVDYVMFDRVKDKDSLEIMKLYDKGEEFIYTRKSLSTVTVSFSNDGDYMIINSECAP